MFTLVCSGAFAALSAPPSTIKTKKFEGSLVRQGAQVNIRWSTWIDLPLATAKRRITSWASATKVIEDRTEFSIVHQATSKRPVRFRVKRKAPVFFIPDPTLLFDAHVTELKDGSFNVRWNLVEGLPKRATRSWTLAAQGDGTRVTHESEIEFPFSPPSALFDDNPDKQLREELERFRQAMGASRLSRTGPKAEKQ